MQYPLESINKLIKLLDDDSLSALMTFKADIINILAKFMNISSNEYGLIWSYESFGKYADLLSYVRENLSADFKINLLEGKFNYSYYTLSRKFKEDTGICLKEYIDKMLIARGKQALLVSNKSIKEIAHSLKFCDQYYFSRFFKKYTGLSPKEYRLRYMMK
jgi:YesN/AraC family two-component response regulator